MRREITFPSDATTIDTLEIEKQALRASQGFKRSGEGGEIQGIKEEKR